MESVPLKPVALGKAISKGDEENLNLITVSSAWEQKVVVMKGADFCFHVKGHQWRDQKRQHEIYNYAIIWP